MKKNDLILVIAVSLYSVLFYQQGSGINFLIFNLAILLGLILKNKDVCYNLKWLGAAAGCILSAMCITYYGNTLSLIANLISLSLISALSFNSNSSVVLSIIFSIFSYITAPIYMYIDYVARRKTKDQTNREKFWRKAFLIIIPIFIAIIFILMYQQSNPFFNELIQKINLDFISWSWIGFTLGGFILLYGFFYHRQIKKISELEENTSNNLEEKDDETSNFFGRILSMDEQDFSGRVLFGLLNLLLVIVNALDINFMFIDHKLPAGIGFSQFVHQGIDMIIISILIAIVIILYYFRGSLNFYKKNKTIKILAYIWIVQNVMMLISTAMRNDMYIEEFGLTYKRIGVYFYLFLSILGLITTFIKIMLAKSNLYLFRVNGWMFYAVLVIACFFKWDVMITNYNLTEAKCTEEEYLFKLSDANLPQLVPLYNDIYNTKKNIKMLCEYGDSSYMEKKFCSRVYDFLKHKENLDWQSWSYEQTRIYNDLTEPAFINNITHFKFWGEPNVSLNTIYCYDKLKDLTVKHCIFSNIKEVYHFTQLEKLDVKENPIFNIKGIEVLSKLQYINICNTNITDYSPLYKLKTLKEIRLNGIEKKQLDDLKLNLPDTKIFLEY